MTIILRRINTNFDSSSIFIMVNELEKQRKFQLVLIISMLSTMFFLFTPPSAAVLEDKPTVQPGDYWNVERLFSSEDPTELVVKSQANISIWFLNVTEYANFLVNNDTSGKPATFNTLEDGTIDQYSTIPGVYVIREQLSVDILNATPYNLPKEVTNPSDGTESVYLYVVAQNHDSTEAKFMIHLEPKPYFLDHLRSFMKFSSIVVQIMLIIWLFFSIKEAKRDNEEHRIKSYAGWGFGFTLALVSKLIMEAAHYYDRDVGLFLYPQNRLQGAIVSVLFPSAVNTAIPTVIFLMTFGGAFIGYIFVIEKVIKDKKPILTVNLAIASCLMPLIWVLPETPVAGPVTWADILTLYLLASVIIGLVMVFTTYINVALKTTGNLRRKAIFTMLGVVLPMAFQILEHFDFLPLDIANLEYYRVIIAQAMVLLGFLLFYKAMKKE